MSINYSATLNNSIHFLPPSAFTSHVCFLSVSLKGEKKKRKIDSGTTRTAEAEDAVSPALTHIH